MYLWSVKRSVHTGWTIQSHHPHNAHALPPHLSVRSSAKLGGGALFFLENQHWLLWRRGAQHRVSSYVEPFTRGVVACLPRYPDRRRPSLACPKRLPFVNAVEQRARECEAHSHGGCAHRCHRRSSSTTGHTEEERWTVEVECLWLLVGCGRAERIRHRCWPTAAGLFRAGAPSTPNGMYYVLLGDLRLRGGRGQAVLCP
jgi:hypothetical protein